MAAFEEYDIGHSEACKPVIACAVLIVPHIMSFPCQKLCNMRHAYICAGHGHIPPSRVSGSRCTRCLLYVEHAWLTVTNTMSVPCKAFSMEDLLSLAALCNTTSARQLVANLSTAQAHIIKTYIVCKQCTDTAGRSMLTQGRRKHSPFQSVGCRPHPNLW